MRLEISKLLSLWILMKRVDNALRKQNTDRNNNLTKVIAIFSRIGNQKEDLSFYLHIHFAKSKIDK